MMNSLRIVSRVEPSLLRDALTLLIGAFCSIACSMPKAERPSREIGAIQAGDYNESTRLFVYSPRGDYSNFEMKLISLDMDSGEQTEIIVDKAVDQVVFTRGGTRVLILDRPYGFFVYESRNLRFQNHVIVDTLIDSCEIENAFLSENGLFIVIAVLCPEKNLFGGSPKVLKVNIATHDPLLEWSANGRLMELLDERGQRLLIVQEDGVRIVDTESSASRLLLNDPLVTSSGRLAQASAYKPVFGPENEKQLLSIENGELVPVTDIPIEGLHWLAEANIWFVPLLAGNDENVVCTWSYNEKDFRECREAPEDFVFNFPISAERVMLLHRKSLHFRVFDWSDLRSVPIPNRFREIRY